MSGGYFGTRKGALPCRSGKAKYENGSVYDGDFENDQRSGWGMQCFPDESVFVGEWAADIMNGKSLALCPFSSICNTIRWEIWIRTAIISAMRTAVYFSLAASLLFDPRCKLERCLQERGGTPSETAACSRAPGKMGSESKASGYRRTGGRSMQGSGNKTCAMARAQLW